MPAVSIRQQTAGMSCSSAW